MADIVKQVNVVATWDGNKLNVGLKTTQDGLKSVETQAEKTTKTLKERIESAKQSWERFATPVNQTLEILGKVGAAVSKAFDISRDAAKFNEAAKSLESQFGVSAQATIDKLSKVAQGTISDQELLLSANRAFTLGVVQNTEQLADLLALARSRAKALGTETNQAFSDIVTGVGRASPQILDNLGIITKGYDEEAKAQGRNVDAAFILQKLLKDNASEIASAKTATATAADSFERMGAQTKNAALAVGNFLAPAMSGIGSIFSGGLSVVREYFDTISGKLEDVRAKAESAEISKAFDKFTTVFKTQSSDAGKYFDTLIDGYSKANKKNNDGLAITVGLTKQELELKRAGVLAGKIKADATDAEVRAIILSAIEAKKKADIDARNAAARQKALADEKETRERIKADIESEQEEEKRYAIQRKADSDAYWNSVKLHESETAEIRAQVKQEQDSLNASINQGVDLASNFAQRFERLGYALIETGNAASQELGGALVGVSQTVQKGIGYFKDYQAAGGGAAGAIVVGLEAVLDTITSIVEGTNTVAESYKSLASTVDNYNVQLLQMQNAVADNAIKVANETYTAQEKLLRDSLGLSELENQVKQDSIENERASLQKSIDDAIKANDEKAQNDAQHKLDLLDAQVQYNAKQKELEDARNAEILKQNNIKEANERQIRAAQRKAQRAEIEARFAQAEAQAYTIPGYWDDKAKKYVWPWEAQKAYREQISSSKSSVLGAFDAIPAFAQGGSFVTNGPQVIMVGDNASGRERVDVTPLGSTGGSKGGATFTGPVTITANNPQEFFRALQTYQRQYGVL